MNPIENGESGLSVRQKLNAIIEPTGWTRPQAVAAFAGGFVPQDGQVYAIGAMFYQGQTGATGIPDLPGLVPFGPAYPDHYAENTVPGTTDMTLAFRAAMDNSHEVRLRAVSYLVSGNIRTYARNGKRLIGESKINSRILATVGSYNVLTFYTGQFNPSGVPLSCRGVELMNFGMDSAGGSGMTGGFMINFEERCTYGLLADLIVDNAFNGIDLTAAAYTHVERVFVTGSRKPLPTGTAIQISSNENAGTYNPDDPAGGAKPTDLHLTDVQINSESTLSPSNPAPYATAIYIGAADGVYIDKGHFRGATNVLVFETAELPNRNVVASVDINQCYFDGVTGSHVRFQGYGNGHSFTQVGGTTPITMKARSIKFNDCRFRAAAATAGSITFSNMTSGAWERVSIRGGQIRDNTYSGIRDAAAVAGAFGLIVEGVEFSGNNTIGSATHGDIYMRSERHMITGNSFEIGDQNTDVGYNIRLLAGVVNGSQVSGNNFVDSPITAQSRRVEVQSADFVFDNPGYTRITRGQAVIGPAFRVLAVNHNQPVTPDIGDFTLTFRSTDTGFSRFWVDNVTSTQFTINLNANPATAVTIDWRVDTERK